MAAPARRASGASRSRSHDDATPGDSLSNVGAPAAVPHRRRIPSGGAIPRGTPAAACSAPPPPASAAAAPAGVPPPPTPEASAAVVQPKKEKQTRGPALPASLKICKCAACDILSTNTPTWGDYERVAVTRDKQKIEVNQPKGERCEVHHVKYMKGFQSVMTWEAFCKMYREVGSFKEVVDNMQIDSAAEKDFPVSVVSLEGEHWIQMRTVVEVLSHDELAKKLAVSSLPQHMKSVPKIKVPRKLFQPGALLPPEKGGKETEDQPATKKKAKKKEQPAMDIRTPLIESSCSPHPGPPHPSQFCSACNLLWAGLVWLTAEG